MWTGQPIADFQPGDAPAGRAGAGEQSYPSLDSGSGRVWATILFAGNLEG